MEDATAAGVLDAANVHRARLLVVAAPRGFQTQRIIELARKANPKIRTAIRTHSAGHFAHFERQGWILPSCGEGGAFERRSADGLCDLSESQPHHDRTDGRDIP
jgi:hypothetical protein